MDIISFFTYSLELLVFLYLGGAALYILVFAIAGLFSIKKRNRIGNKQRKVAVLIPGYKEDAVIVEVARRALEQSYDASLFDVVVIADSFEPITLEKLRRLPIKLIEVSFEKSTKSKALNAAMAEIGDDYHVALVLDADNVMEYDFVERINNAFNRGFKVVQGHRVAKNTNTSFAILDAISEEVNNHIFRKGHRVLGLSSALIGSGMAFDYHFFKKTMSEVNAVGGFDKELELKLLRDGNIIEYLPKAIVYDEKVQKSEVFSNQRRRWLSAQFIYFRRFVLSGLRELFFKGNVDFADKVYQMISPPRILLLGGVGVCTALYLMHQLLGLEFLQLPSVYWYAAFACTVVAFLFSIPKAYYSGSTAKAVGQIPKAFWIMFASLFRLKGANKKFIHTQHGTVNT